MVCSKTRHRSPSRPGRISVMNGCSKRNSRFQQKFHEHQTPTNLIVAKEIAGSSNSLLWFQQKSHEHQTPSNLIVAKETASSSNKLLWFQQKSHKTSKSNKFDCSKRNSRFQQQFTLFQQKSHKHQIQQNLIVAKITGGSSNKKQSPVAATRDDSCSLTTRSQKKRCIRRSPMLEPCSRKLQPYVAVLEPAREKATTASHRCWSRGEEKLQPHVAGAGTRQ